MISVFIEENGDVSYRCTICDRTETITIDQISRPFGDMISGNLLLVMLEHYRQEALSQ